MKQNVTMQVCEISHPTPAYALLKMKPTSQSLPGGIMPGQFAQVLITDSPSTYLRRPISICMANYEAGEIWLLVRDAGAGTHSIINSVVGSTFSIILPLGNGFAMPEKTDRPILLAGGGVGVAPLLYYGKVLSQNGFNVHFALGARTSRDLLLLEEFEKYGTLHLATEDGSAGTKGFVTGLPIFGEDLAMIACCGPTPMMKAVAKIAASAGTPCFASLENTMACGLGACLCCVEDTADKGNVCVCTDGPVFNINQLKWQL